jgi:hypothetical protein
VSWFSANRPTLLQPEDRPFLLETMRASLDREHAFRSALLTQIETSSRNYHAGLEVRRAEIANQGRARCHAELESRAQREHEIACNEKRMEHEIACHGKRTERSIAVTMCVGLIVLLVAWALDPFQKCQFNPPAQQPEV